ncbi:MAG: SelB C-terminal domain-containing protein, partial [Gemmatimonadaceae bacterium]|nr:SelB C-terminal domain-containing protein [Gemmatimonadaceae bacterium]
VVRTAVEQGELRIQDGLVARAGWEPQFSPADRAAIETIETLLRRLGREAPTATEIAAVAGPRTPALLRLLERERRVIQLGEARYVTPQTWREILLALRSATGEARLYGAGELREMFGLSRKYSIPILEGCDRAGICTRQDDGRRFHWGHLPPDVGAFLDSVGNEP